MIACRICRFETELDDVVLRHGADECVCLRCYDRETGGARLMPKALRREIDAVLAAV